jgi:dTDP-L-rhamnose 4-epimerase
VRVAELAARLAEALGIEVDARITGEARAGDIRHCFADVGRGRDLLGFEAGVSLADGLPELAEWVAAQRVEERGDTAVSELRARGLVA